MEEKTQERIKTFIERYGKLVEEMQVDFVNYPMFQPDGTGNWKIVVQTQPMDISDQPKKSPFVV